MTGVALVKSHADLSASSAYRWMACGGSVRLSRGKKNVSSIYAIEGTIAHQVAEKCLSKNIDPEMFIGLELTDPETGTKVTVTEEMADHVWVFVNYCRSRKVKYSWVERKFSLAKLNPPDDMYGTSDFSGWGCELLDAAFQDQEPIWTGVLEIVDLKYGQGVPVEVEENEQEMYYALGAVLAIQAEENLPIDRVRLTIVQPRLPHKDGPIRSWEISIEELLAFADHLLARARAALAPDAPLVPGDHCRFCPAAGDCPALAEQSLALAQMDFSDDLELPPPPESLTVERLAQVLKAADMIESFLNACRARGLALTEQGTEVPGFKAVAKKANRKWVNITDAALFMLQSGATPEQVYEEPEVRSVAQMEKKLGKAKFARLTANADFDLISKISSGYSLVPIADARPALLLGAQQDFEVLPNNAGQEETQ